MRCTCIGAQASARRRRLQLPALHHLLQRVVADRQRQIDAPTPPARLVAGEDDLGRVQHLARTQLRLAPRLQRLDRVGKPAGG
jgi:hypothetical protein